MSQQSVQAAAADCHECPHRADRFAVGRCAPGDRCVRVASGRQIARFFDTNPDLAGNYADDVFWERRAIAARFLGQAQLHRLIDDPDEVVRRVVAYRLPIDELGALAKDPDREVRITVADRLPAEQLESLVDDQDYLVRQYVARRLRLGRLFRLIGDPDREVRRTVASRLPVASLGLMAADREPEVRQLVAERIDPTALGPLLDDADWRVRLAACERAPMPMLVRLRDDEDQDVRAVVLERLRDYQPTGRPMDTQLASPEILTRLSADLKPADGIDALTASINEQFPELDFRHILTRRGWHRLGGVVDKDHARVAVSILHWIEDEFDNDVEALIATHADDGYFATQLSGQTHYFTASRGDAPQDFVQIEIEELQERLERPLVKADWYPDSVEEFLEPLDFPHTSPEPVRQAYYQFRRIMPIDRLFAVGAAGGRQKKDLQRFFDDWAASSASDHDRFCDHWVLSLREYRNREGELQLTAKPVPVFLGEIPELPQDKKARGSTLANAIHHYDRQMGYPFAWYFMMLTRKAENYALAESVLADQMGAYEYLPGKDLKVLRDWEQSPYGV